MNFNPNQIMGMIKSGQNPQSVMINLMENQMQSTPMGVNLLNLAKNNKTAEIEQIARNICSQRGVNYDQAFNSFKQLFGIK